MGKRVAIALATIIVAGSAVAQDRPAQPPRRRAIGAAGQLAEAERIERRATQLAVEVQQMLASARRARDTIKITCLNDKLAQVNATLRTVQDRRSRLVAAARANDEARRNHDFTVLATLATRVTELTSDARRCLGQDPVDHGSELIVEIDRDVPDEDLDLDPPDDWSYPPPPLSPFL